MRVDQSETIQWSKLKSGDQYVINLVKYKVGNIVMPNAPSTAFIDSGTSYAYMSTSQLKAIDRAITKLCEEGMYNCLGERVNQNCYKFKPSDNQTVKDFFLSYPIFNFVTQEHGEIKWFPSEYFNK